MKNYFIKLIVLSTILCAHKINAQVGIGTEAPQSTLDIRGVNHNGAVTATDGVLVPRVNALTVDGTEDGQLVFLTNNITGTGTVGVPQYTKGFHFWDVTNSAWTPVKTPGLNSLDLIKDGTVIAIGNELQVATELTVLMSANSSYAGSSTTKETKNMDIEIIDNENIFTGTSTGNTLVPVSTGIYQIMINAQIALSGSTTSKRKPVIGLWDNDAGEWVARNNDHMSVGNQYTMTLITVVQLTAGTNYSFRQSEILTTHVVKATSSGSTGSGPVSFFSLKRLK